MRLPVLAKIGMYASLCLAVVAITSCKSADRATEICEQNNRECTQNCKAALSPASLQRTPHPLPNQCDIHCEIGYQGCLKRRQNKQIKGVGDY
ncbi:MAG: hypothetical protein JNJ69_02835 [Leptospiraceae bacterium]|nr:hypothetical protein [Leptospiraceae bacterium]